MSKHEHTHVWDSFLMPTGNRPNYLLRVVINEVFFSFDKPKIEIRFFQLSTTILFGQNLQNK